MLLKVVYQVTNCLSNVSIHFRAQPDWVEAAGEHPPVITADQIPRAGVFPQLTPAKPLVIHRENKIAIEPGIDVGTEKIVSGSEQVAKLKDSKDSHGDGEKK